MTDTGRLKVTTAGERETVITSSFDAPRGKVFDAWTKPELLSRWFGPKGWTLAACEVDLMVGGTWRFVVRRANGSVGCAASTARSSARSVSFTPSRSTSKTFRASRSSR